jgi:hypothetical protein
MNSTFFESDILIPDEWAFATGYDVKIKPSWLNKRMTFKNIKNMLEGIYLNVKKGFCYIIWFGFKVFDDDIFDIQNASDFNTPATQNPSKTRKASRKINIKKKFQHADINRKIKKKNSDFQLNVRKF